MLNDEVRAVAAGFRFTGNLVDAFEIKSGHINRTYRLTFQQQDGIKEYILQRINTFAFKNPRLVMENVQGVTDHLKKAMMARGENPDRRVLSCVPALDGTALFQDGEGGCWRAYDFVGNARAYDQVDHPDQFREAGKAFGRFQKMLSDYPIEKLHDTIPDFHDTKKRYLAFEKAVAEDRVGRVQNVPAEIDFFRRRAKDMGVIVDMIEAGEIPLRVTHNDTKINNVMLDAQTGEGLCVIDLDTVMAGSALYDFGDAIRFGASTAVEDEKDLSRVSLDMTLFEAFADGFISQTADTLTKREIENLSLSALVITYELSMRFLTDYLQGDVYFRIHYPEHNLVRVHTQLKLLQDMEAKRAQMDATINELVAKY